MTPEALQSLLDAEDSEGCIALFADAGEATRRALSKTAAARLRKLGATGWEEQIVEASAPSDLPAGVLSRWKFVSTPRLRAARIAVLATATLQELKKFREDCALDGSDAVAVLSARRPPWIADWANHILSWQGVSEVSDLTARYWYLLRGLVRAELCPRPRDPRYLWLMIGCLTPRQATPEPSLRERLLEDPGLLDDEVWELFDVELPLRLRGIFAVDPYSHAKDRWDVTLTEFAAEGRLSRTRLLEACISALERDDRDPRVRWLISLHHGLEPTVAELADRLDRYLGLVASRDSLIVNFALGVLGILDSADCLPPVRLVSGIRPAMLSRFKGTVLKALKYVDRAALRDPSQRTRGAAVAIDAFAHESPGVHKAVLDWIERHGAQSEADVVELLRSRIDIVAPSERTRLSSWIGTASIRESSLVSEHDVDELFARASTIEPAIADALSLNALIAAIQRGCGEVPGIQLLETIAPRLDPEKTIEPIEDLDELVALFLTVLESAASPDVLERLLDGVSRLCSHHPDDLEMRTAPLRVRATQIVANEWTGGYTGSILRSPFAKLALAWLGEPVEATPAHPMLGSHVVLFIERIQRIAERAAKRVAVPLLSAPTHVGFWIDLCVLISRLHAWEDQGVMPDTSDLSLALVRLAPDPNARIAAREAAATLKGPLTPAVHYALGGDVSEIGPDASVWIAAARARAPFEDDLRVESRHPDLGPDAGLAAQTDLLPGRHGFVDWCDVLRRTILFRTPELPETVRSDLPTVIVHALESGSGRTELPWAATLWPLGREALFGAGAAQLLGLECNASDAAHYRPFLEPLLDPDMPLRTMGRLLLVGALSSNRPEFQGLAIDAVILAIDDGRLDGPQLGAALRRLLIADLLKLNRVAKALGDAARLSSLHARVIAEAIESMVIGLSSPPRGFHTVLELLKELLIETGESLTALEGERWFRELNASGKTGKLVRDLLQHQGEANPDSRKSAALRALANRVERAERWSRAREHPRPPVAST